MGENSSTRNANQLDRLLAVPMFVVAVVFLLAAGFLIHTEPGELLPVEQYSQTIRRICKYVLVILYLLYVAEAVAHQLTGSRNMRQHIFYLLIPFFRLCPRDHIDGSHAWIVGLGWCETTSRFERSMSRMFSVPMILIALSVLPVVAAELMWQESIEADPTWKFILQTATGFIWMAFVFEFFVMITVVDKKARYCKKNWIDIAVIVVPFFAFLRAARLGRLMKLQQISRTAKVFRMRGLALRSWRAFVTLEVIDTLMRRDPNYRMDKIEGQILEKEEEIAYLKNEMERLRLRILDPSPSKNENPDGSNPGTPEMKFVYPRKQ